MNVAIIPARGGSKRIPRKNIRPFCGKPIIAWSIEAAIESQCFDRIIVSTEDEEIAEIAKRYGAEVPFMRPQTLADDYTGTIPVIRHSIEQLGNSLSADDPVCCIYPTAPFLRSEDLATGLAMLKKNECHYVLSVTSYSYPIQRAIRITGDGKVEMIYSDFFYTRSQDLEEAYHDAGQFYWGRVSAWMQEIMPFSHSGIALRLPRHRVLDIDTLEDWEHAEALFNALQKNK